ncbi:uncharacterized protein LOC134254074 [Saccostrea cucullata]|uniref:uncharacterized protein LOC134254074 n=1 Tax=Saccostrea cuccullata TaxID=36930 RepID=UPI002ED1BFF1
MSLSHFNKPYYLIFFAVCHIVVGDPVEDDSAAIKKVLKNLSNNNRRLEKENEILKTELWDLKSKVSKLQKFEVLEEGQEESIVSKSEMRNRRLLIGQITTTPSTPEPAHSIPFYAYMSKSEPTPSNHHTFLTSSKQT